MAVLVLLPGMDGTTLLRGEFAAAFADRMQSGVKVAPVSYPPDRVLGYDELLPIVRAALPVDEPFVLLGESFSGPLAIRLAAESPPGLCGLVLCCTFARRPVSLPVPLRKLLGALPPAALPAWLTHYVLLGRYATPPLREALREIRRRVRGEVLRARLQAVLAVDVSEQLRHVRVPILDLRAAEDRLVPKSCGRHIASVAGNLTQLELPGPHLLLEAFPQQAAAAIGNFLSRVA